MEPIFFIVYVMSFIVSITMNWKQLRREPRMARWFFIGLHGISLAFFASVLLKIQLPPLFKSYNDTMSSMIKHLLP